MQYDMGRFDQPLVDETQPKAHVWTDIGEAEVEHSIFGKAKVRVYRKQDEVRGALGWTLLTVSAVVGAVWLINTVSRQPEIAYVAPPAPVVEVAVPEPKVALPVVPQNKPRAVAPVATKSPLPQPPVHAAPVTTKPAALDAPAVSAAATASSAPLAVNPAPVAVKPLAPAAPAAATVPVAIKPEVTQVPAASEPSVAGSN